MESLIAEDLVEQGASGGIGVHHIAIEREIAGGALLRQVQEGQQGALALGLDPEVVQAPLAGGQPGRLESGVRRGGQAAQQGAAAIAKQLGVALLVLGVAQEQSAQARVASQFGGAQDVPATVGLGFGETQQIARAPDRVAPEPPLRPAPGRAQGVTAKRRCVGVELALPRVQGISRVRSPSFRNSVSIDTSTTSPTMPA